MSMDEKKLSDYIDSLNKEQKPAEFDDSEKLNELYKTVKMVRRLKEPTLPNENFAKGLPRILQESSAPNKKKRNWLMGIASIAAMFAIIFTFTIFSSHDKNNIVYAMENAFQDIDAYHGFIQIKDTAANGTSTTQAKLEVWADKNGHYYVKNLDGTEKELVTVNNGQKKWQINSKKKNVAIFPASPDEYQFTFELGKEINFVKNAVSTKEMGEDMVAGRKATILEVTPQGGKPYKIWIDQETKMPIRKQTVMQNAIQYQVSYTKIDFHDAIPKELTTYQVPKGFAVINTNPEQFVSNLEEAKEMVGFTPVVPSKPNQISVEINLKVIKTYYDSTNKTIVLMQGKSNKAFTPGPSAMIGSIGNIKVEIQSPIEANHGILGGGAYTGVTDMSSIRWIQDGYEYAVVGNTSLEDLASFAKNLTGNEVKLPQELSNKPKVDVPFDMELETNEQQNADAGHSIWKLDPVFASQVFVSLKISPEGITGIYPIKTADLTIISNNGKEAIVAVSGDITPISKVYLKRVVRQDSSGIWTVVGYNPK